MPLIPHTDTWLATIEGAPHLEQRFDMPAGASIGQACLHIWTIWSHARANGSNDPLNPVASQFLRLTKVASAFVEVGELDAAEQARAA